MSQYAWNPEMLASYYFRHDLAPDSDDAAALRLKLGLSALESPGESWLNVDMAYAVWYSYFDQRNWCERDLNAIHDVLLAFYSEQSNYYLLKLIEVSQYMQVGCDVNDIENYIFYSQIK